MHYINQNTKGVIMSLIVGIIIILLGIWACVWEPYDQELIIRSIPQAFT